MFSIPTTTKASDVGTIGADETPIEHGANNAPDGEAPSATEASAQKTQIGNIDS